MAYMKRKMVNKQRSAKKFKRQGRKTKAANLRVMRGGLRF